MTELMKRYEAETEGGRMKVRHLIQNIIDSMENPTLDDVWRHLIVWYSIAGQEVKVTKKDVQEVLDGRNL
jgi:hypothetical protein